MRKIIVPIFAVVLTSVAVSFAVSSSWNSKKYSEDLKLSVNNTLEKYGVEVVGASDTKFDSELKKFVGNNEAVLPMVDALKPLAIFVKNRSQNEIVGISLRWTAVKSTGEKKVLPQTVNHPGVLMGMKPLDPSMVGKTSIINRDATQLFCYFSTNIQQQIVNPESSAQNPSIRSGRGSTARDVAMLHSQVARAKTVLLDQAETLSVSVDGIFFDDGSFVGENLNFFFDETRGMVEARRDFLRELASALNAGSTASLSLERAVTFASKNAQSITDANPDNPKETGDEMFRASYRVTLGELSKQVVNMRRIKWTDEQILNSFRSARIEDFRELRRIAAQ